MQVNATHTDAKKSGGLYAVADVMDNAPHKDNEWFDYGIKVTGKRDILTHGPYEGVHRQRQVDIAKKLFEAMDIARDDKERRQDWVMRGFRQFDAPVSLVLTYDRTLDPGATCHFDLGALSYGIVLAAWDRGLGTVVNGQGIMRSDIVREIAGIPDDEVIMTCIAMGYPDDSFSANAVRSVRGLYANDSQSRALIAQRAADMDRARTEVERMDAEVRRAAYRAERKVEDEQASRLARHGTLLAHPRTT